MKICRWCLATEDEASFYKGHNLCKNCYSLDQKHQREKHHEKRLEYDRNRGTGWNRSGREKYNPTPDEKHDRYLKRTYGISLEEYTQLWEQQNKVCAICKQECNRSTTDRLCVDHCHTTGKVRGLLCFQCNVGLGKFKDNPEYLTEAANYVRRHS